MSRRWLSALTMGAVLMHGVPACVGGPEDDKLNPQPLPPGEPPDDKSGEPTHSPASGGTSDNGASPETPGANADAGAPDAGDAGDGGDE